MTVIFLFLNINVLVLLWFPEEETQDHLTDAPDNYFIHFSSVQRLTNVSQCIKKSSVLHKTTPEDSQRPNLYFTPVRDFFITLLPPAITSD